MKYILLLATLSIACTAQVQYRTRTVVLFGELEKRLSSGVDRATLLAEDFEERRCAQPGTPIPRDEWLAAPPEKISFRQEAVHDYGSIDVYSALGSDSNSQYGVVDIWQKDGDKWKLAVRYICPVSSAKADEPLPNRY